MNASLINRALVALVLVATTTGAHAWKHKTANDTLTGKSIHTAEIRSSNSLRLSYPYQGANRGWLSVRKHPQHGLDVYVTIDRGQIVCPYVGCSIRFRVDDGDPTEVPAIRSSDGASTTLFFSYPHEAVELFRSGKEIAIQLTLFRSGEHVLRFNPPRPLIWE